MCVKTQFTADRPIDGQQLAGPKEEEGSMPRRRPRVGQSVVDRTTWGAAGQPPDQFDLTFDNGTFDYTYDPGGGAPPVSLLGLAPLLGLIVAADGLPPPSVDA